MLEKARLAGSMYTLHAHGRPCDSSLDIGVVV